MLRKKPKIKKISLPLKKMTEKEKDYAAVLMEDMNHNVKAFWEVLDDVKKRGDATFEKVGNVKEDTESIKRELVTMNYRLDNIEKEIASIKSEIKELRLSLSKKADIEKLENLQLRVIKIEEYLKLS